VLVALESASRCLPEPSIVAAGCTRNCELYEPVRIAFASIPGGETPQVSSADAGDVDKLG